MRLSPGWQRGAMPPAPADWSLHRRRSNGTIYRFFGYQKDPILAAQYLSAVVGSIVSTSGIPKADQADILKQLLDFIQYVYDQQSKANNSESTQPSGDAFGKWTPK